MTLFAELRRRKVFRVAVAYAIVGWLLAQVADTVFPILLLPDWLLRAFTMALILGFPLAVALAWAFEVRPESAQKKETNAAVRARPETPWIQHGLMIAAGLAFGLLAGGWLARSVAPESGQDQVSLTPVRLTANPLETPVIGSALSPDGNMLAYLLTDGAYLLIVDSGVTQKLPLPGDLQVRRGSVNWLPDGAHILFSAERDRQRSLWRSPIVGSGLTKIADGVAEAAISSDGRRIAFMPRIFGSRILVMGPDGEAQRLLVDFGSDHSIRHIAWSPDGRFLLAGAMVGAASARNLLLAVDAETGEAHTVFEDARTFQNWRGFLPFLWTPENRLIFGRREAAPNLDISNLWQLELDPETANPRSPPKKLTELTGYNFADLSVSAAGDRLAFLLEQNQADVWIGELADDNRSFQRTYRQTTDERDEYPRGWSHDSATLYIEAQQGLAYGLFGTQVGEPDLRPLSSGRVENVHARVAQSPDGDWLLHWDDTRLLRVPASGGATELVLEATQISADFACPLPDTRRPTCIVGQPEGSNRYAFYAFEPAYGRGEKLVEIDDYPPFTNWSLSPDARSVAVVHNNGSLRLLDLDTGKVREYSEPGWSFGEFIDWSADGSGVFMDGYRGDWPLLKLLLFYSIEDRSVHVLRDTPSEWHVHPKASPDGKYLAFSAMRFSGNVWMLEADEAAP